MKNRPRIAVGDRARRLALCALTFAAAGCGTAGRIAVPDMDPQSAASQALTDYDANSDGAISGGELDRVPGLKSGLGVVDRDKNGQVTAEEIAARLKKYQDDRVGLIQLYAQATLDGQPLSGAKVTLAPEKFMGPAVKAAQGVTDGQGLCMFQTEGEEVPGVRCGIFRIEVSKQAADGKETIPDRYNVKTTLGEEVGLDSPIVNRGISLNLSSR